MSGYNNPFMNPYGFGQMPGQFMQPGMPQQAQAAVQMPQQQVIRVNGENGARSYQIGPNSSAMLLDENGEIVWLVTSDGAGYKTVSAYDIMPHKAEPPKEYTDLESRVKKLEDMMGGKRYGNSGNSPATGKRTDGPDGGKD